MNDINENAAWHKVFTSGSEALKSKLKKVHAKNPKFQSFLKSIGHEGEQKSVAQAKRDVGQINKAKAKAAAPKPVGRTEVIKQIAQKLAARKQVAKHRAAWGGEVPGAEYDNPISMARAGHTIKGYRLGEDATQTDEALLPKQQKVRQDLIDKEMAEKKAKRQVGTTYGRYASLARKMRKVQEEVVIVDEAKRAINITKKDLEIVKSGDHETVKNHLVKLISRAADTKTNARPLRADKAKEFLDTIHGSTNVGQLQKMAYNMYLGGDDEGKSKYGSLHVYKPMSKMGRSYQRRYGIEEEVELDEVTKQEAEKVLGGAVKTRTGNEPTGKHPIGYRRARKLARAKLKQLLTQRKGK